MFVEQSERSIISRVGKLVSSELLMAILSTFNMIRNDSFSVKHLNQLRSYPSELSDGFPLQAIGNIPTDNFMLSIDQLSYFFIPSNKLH